MSDLISQITADLQKQIESFQPELEVRDVGNVIEAGDGSLGRIGDEWQRQRGEQRGRAGCDLHQVAAGGLNPFSSHRRLQGIAVNKGGCHGRAVPDNDRPRLESRTGHAQCDAAADY